MKNSYPKSETLTVFLNTNNKDPFAHYHGTLNLKIIGQT